MNIKELCDKWNERAKDYRNRGFTNDAEEIRECILELESIPPEELLCPTPEVKGLYPVVLYFKNADDAQELIDAVKIVKPHMISKPL